MTRQLVSDVPLCVLLSGGLDSSAIAAIASEVYRKERREKLRTFSIDYVNNDKNFRPSAFQPGDDAPWVRIVSDYLKTAHENCLLDTPELTDALFPAVLARDLPGMTDVDSSLLLFSRWIKERATVGLSGECADEVFGGYPWFYRPHDASTFPWSQHLDARVRVFSPLLNALIKPREYVAARYEEALGEVPRLSGDTAEEDRMRELYWLNLTRWMPTLLDRKDRMSMYWGWSSASPTATTGSSNMSGTSLGDEVLQQKGERAPPAGPAGAFAPGRPVAEEESLSKDPQSRLYRRPARSDAPDAGRQDLPAPPVHRRAERPGAGALHGPGHQHPLVRPADERAAAPGVPAAGGVLDEGVRGDGGISNWCPNGSN